MLTFYRLSDGKLQASEACHGMCWLVANIILSESTHHANTLASSAMCWVAAHYMLALMSGYRRQVNTKILHDV